MSSLYQQQIKLEDEALEAYLTANEKLLREKCELYYFRFSEHIKRLEKAGENTDSFRLGMKMYANQEEYIRKRLLSPTWFDKRSSEIFGKLDAFIVENGIQETPYFQAVRNWIKEYGEYAKNRTDIDSLRMGSTKAQEAANARRNPNHPDSNSFYRFRYRIRCSEESCLQKELDWTIIGVPLQDSEKVFIPEDVKKGMILFQIHCTSLILK